MFIKLINNFSGRKKFESLGFENDEKIALLEKQLAEALLIAADADKRFDEVFNFI